MGPETLTRQALELIGKKTSYKTGYKTTYYPLAVEQITLFAGNAACIRQASGAWIFQAEIDMPAVPAVILSFRSAEYIPNLSCN